MNTFVRKPHIFLRVATLLAIVLNVAYNYAYTNLPFNARGVGQESARFFNYFSPAPYAFSIWGLIYLAFLLYGVIQLLPSQCHKAIYDQLAAPLLLANVLASVWLTMFTHELILLSVFIILCMLGTAAVMFFYVHEDIKLNARSKWYALPFSLFFGWMSVATLANTAAYTAFSGLNGGTQGDSALALALTAIAFLAGIITGFSVHDWIYPAVVAWAGFAIYINDRNINHLNATAALVSAVILLISAVIIGVRSTHKHNLLTTH